MDNLKKDFLTELTFFSMISKSDMEKGFTLDQIVNTLEKCATSFYRMREEIDDYAFNKTYFIKTYVYQIVKGNNLESLANEFIDELQNKQELGAHNL